MALLVIDCSRRTELTQATGKFTFAFLTDIHLQPELNAVEGFKKAIDTINILNPDFVVTGGDLVMDAMDVSYGRADSLYNLYLDVSRGFHMPVYNTIGNHEHFGLYRREEVDTAFSEYGKKMYEKRIGPRYYSFDYKGWHFMVLDAVGITEEREYIGMIDDEQIEWIKSDLVGIDNNTPIVLSTHIPFITVQTQLAEGSLAATPASLIINNAKDVLYLFWEHNLKLILQGHLHFLEEIYLNEQVHFITAGAVSGRWWKNRPESNPEEGFLMIYVNGEDIDYDYIDYGWVPDLD
ncbi:MAG: hypothetical protein AMS27_14775 [Bacteroides sp. SM23_62_1]|nr:MAG: hypothetical protein AMS27_14775 [Bacteroides sp. SM23_62_1]